MTINLDNKALRDWRVILVIFVLLVSSFLSNNEKPEEEIYDKLDQNTVVRVVDGDTVELANGEKVRYIGMDTPESVDPRKPVECFAKQATIRNKELVLGKVVTLKSDAANRDRYGRLLRYVYVEDKFINLQLISEGYAYSVSFPPNIKYQDIFDNAEKIARERNEGLWSVCE